jgi:hypothetical protein
MLLLNPTPAVLYRLVHEFRPTMLLDEVEALSQDDKRDVLAIVNAGYKVGATVPRCEGKEQKRVECFEVYARSRSPRSGPSPPRPRTAAFPWSYSAGPTSGA